MAPLDAPGAAGARTALGPAALGVLLELAPPLTTGGGALGGFAVPAAAPAAMPGPDPRPRLVPLPAPGEAPAQRERGAPGDGAKLRELFPTVPPAIQARRDDDWLAERVGRVRPDPFNVLFERHWKPVYGYCLSVVGSPDQAEDAAQEAMVRAYAALRNARTRPHFKPWLYSIARNACIDRLRDRSNHDVPLDEYNAGTVGSPAESFEVRERLRAVMEDLRALSERQRGALVMRELSGLSHGEIADALETTPPKAKALIQEARRTLVERNEGRELPCDEYRQELGELAPRQLPGHRLRAHAESCVRCGDLRRHRSFALSALPVLMATLWQKAKLVAHGLGEAAVAAPGGAKATAAVLATAAAIAPAGSGVLQGGGAEGPEAQRAPAAGGGAAAPAWPATGGGDASAAHEIGSSISGSAGAEARRGGVEAPAARQVGGAPAPIGAGDVDGGDVTGAREGTAPAPGPSPSPSRGMDVTEEAGRLVPAVTDVPVRLPRVRVVVDPPAPAGDGDGGQAEVEVDSVEIGLD